MGMRIGGAGNGWASYQSNTIGNWQQRQQNLKSLKSALQTGDLTGAQQAYSSMAAANPKAVNNANSPFAQIGQALKAGNIAGAQSIAQNWQRDHDVDRNTQLNSDGAVATQSFLQSLSNNMSANSDIGNNSPSTQALPDTSTTTSQEQVAQALMAFEKNLFAALQAQNSEVTGTTSSATTSATNTDPNVAATNAAVVANPGQTAAMHGHHHHHHGGGQGGSQFSSELSSLISQTSQSNGGNSTDTNNPVVGLDQSIKNLLSTLGVSGNNASLNSFLQSMSSSMQASSTSGA